MRSHPRHWICILFHAPTVGQSTLDTTFAYYTLVGGRVATRLSAIRPAFSGAGLMWLEPHDNTLLEPPSELGACLARLRSLLKLGCSVRALTLPVLIWW